MWQWLHQFFDDISTEISALSASDRTLLITMAVHEFYNLPRLDQSQISEPLQRLLARLKWLPRWDLTVLREMKVSVLDFDRDSENR